MTTKPSADSAGDLRWFKSSYSSNESADCIEVAATPATVHVRDSKSPEGPRLDFAPEAWTAFLSYAVERA
ncbi:DUF397 domain-containing protein [Streptomyces sp. HPF1205]|uniref:DUF397 domain-containing protein n=1 Tax=Streptomyces sp. HPF1205 TaxID=2873262 RepID=UPI001CEDB4ED|nr:DUF397 domain-containing protein [Streptomyces sp. HPF1205]